MLIHLHERGETPIYLLNESPEGEQYGNIEFIHFTAANFAKLAAQLARKRNTLIINQNAAFPRHAKFLRWALPDSRILVRLGGVYYGKAFIESQSFESIRAAHRRRLTASDMIISTADGTPVDLYMQRVGIAPERYQKWLNGVPEIRNEHNIRRQNQILCISRLHPEKALDYVVRSFAAAIPRLAESYSLRIVGDGPELETLRQLAAQLGVEQRVEFAGHAHDVGPHLYSSKLLLTALSNNTILEALATETPVIALDLGEIRALYGHLPDVQVIDYAPGGYGRIPPEWMDVLVQKTSNAIIDSVNSHGFRNGSASQARVCLMTWDQRLNLELHLYDRLFV
jgi:glycosyltransferase involved in cell wall biosynthesis